MAEHEIRHKHVGQLIRRCRHESVSRIQSGEKWWHKQHIAQVMNRRIAKVGADCVLSIYFLNPMYSICCKFQCFGPRQFFPGITVPSDWVSKSVGSLCRSLSAFALGQMYPPLRGSFSSPRIETTRSPLVSIRIPHMASHRVHVLKWMFVSGYPLRPFIPPDLIRRFAAWGTKERSDWFPAHIVHMPCHVDLARQLR